MKVVVVGAGAFGGWTALHLLRSGAEVILLDAWGPGNSRASSGGETRILRATYGPDATYVQMAIRSLELWRENERRWKRKLFHQTGLIWMAGRDDGFEKASVRLLRDTGVLCEELSAAEATRRWPQINLEGVNWLIHERDAGYLTARRNCQTVLNGFLREGGEYRQLLAAPGRSKAKGLEDVALSDGSDLSADQYVFACGPWLGKMFPDVIGSRISPTRQEVFFFGAPPGDDRFGEERLPVWIDRGERFVYGIPGNERRGFKIADDTRGPAFDPDTEDRIVSCEALNAARGYLRFRFPGLANAPLLESRVCQYEDTADGDFVIDRHPEFENVLLVGGGSGHGYKHGPAVGEIASRMALGAELDGGLCKLSRFKLSRFEIPRPAEGEPG